MRLEKSWTSNYLLLIWLLFLLSFKHFLLGKLLVESKTFWVMHKTPQKKVNFQKTLGPKEPFFYPPPPHLPPTFNFSLYSYLLFLLLSFFFFSFLLLKKRHILSLSTFSLKNNNNWYYMMPISSSQLFFFPLSSLSNPKEGNQGANNSSQFISITTRRAIYGGSNVFYVFLQIMLFQRADHTGKCDITHGPRINSWVEVIKKRWKVISTRNFSRAKVYSWKCPSLGKGQYPQNITHNNAVLNNTYK